MTSITLIRALIFALIASAFIFQTPDQIHGPATSNNAQYSFVPGSRAKQNIDRTTRARIEQTYGKLPIRFEANEGQADARVKFMARGAGYSVFLTGGETVLQLRKGKSGDLGAEEQMGDRSVESVALRMKLSGSNPPRRVSGVGKLQTTSNYFIGNNPAAWRRGVSNYSKVKYESVYPGIDMVWYGNQQMLEHDFLIAPGADPSRIKLSFSGAEKISIDGDGALVLRTGVEDLRLLRPNAWQESNGNRRTVPCDYRLNENDMVEFRLGDYEATLPLVIDPSLVYSTYIGGIGSDSGLDIAVDGAGAAYVTGQTSSSDFPGPSPIQPARGTSSDAFVLKINPAGTAIVFGSWIGGNGNDSASAVSVDQGGNVYLAGSTTSSNFPLQNPLQNSIKGLTDAFAVKINSSGSALLFSTYVGGTGTDNARAMAVDGAGNVYLTGVTGSIDFPVVNAFQPIKNGAGAYASDNRGASWGEIVNGLNGAAVNDLVISPEDSSTIFAGTDRGVFKSIDRGSSWNLLGGTQFIRNISKVIVAPTTPDILYAVSTSQLFKSVNGGATWVQKPISLVRTLAINPATPSILYAGAFNGLLISANGGDSWTPVSFPPGRCGTVRDVASVAVDPITPATLYIGSDCGLLKTVDGGATWTFTGNGLPSFFGPRITRIAISRSDPTTLFALVDDASIFKSTNSGDSWTQLDAPSLGIPGTSGFPLPLVVAPENAEVVYAGSQSSGIYRSNDGGATWNTVNNGLKAINIRAIVIDPNSPERIYAGADSGTEAYVAKLDLTASSLVYSSYLGGAASEFSEGIVVDSAGAAYVAGSTTSADFPVVNAFQSTLGGLDDAFVAKINESGSALSWATFLGGSNLDNAAGIAKNSAGEIFVAGSTTSSNFPVMNAIQPSLNGLQDGFIARLKNDGSGLDFSTYLGGAESDSVTAIAVDSAGALYVTGVTTSLDFPVISAVQPTRGGDPAIGAPDAFVTKLSADGTAIAYSTYLGGSGLDLGNGIAVDAATSAYVTGNTSSSDFPTTPSPIRSGGPSDAFVAKIGVSADLAITITDSLDPVMINNQLTYSLTVTNNGLDPAVGVRVTDTLPAGVSLVSSSASQGICSGASEINCEIGNLASGDSATITITVTPSSAGTITNRASVMSGTPDARPENNNATLDTTVSLLPSIYGRVTTDGGAGFSGVNVAVNGSGRPPVLTTNRGDYQVSELALGGSYTVIPSREGFSFNPPNRTINNLQSDQRADFQGVTCAVSISSANQSFPATGGVGSVTVISPDPHCGWVARSHAPWIKLISAPAGNGGAIVSFKVEPTVGSRTGTITINDNRFTVIQEFNPCGAVTFNEPKTLPINGLQSFSTQTNPVAEDFNNDSVSDLVFNVFQPVAGLSIALSNSAGGYDDARMIYTGGVRAIRTGDLNKDGMNDLAITTTDAPGRLLILNGNGAGGFSEPVILNTGPSPTALAIADFNGDGLSDLAVGAGPLTPPDPTQSNYSLTIHLSDGAGGFAAPRSFGFTTKPGSFPSQIEVGNFNGDGNLDLAVMGSLGPVTIFTGDGSEGFTISTLSDVGLPGMMATGDFNGDLKTDLAVSQSGIFGSATTLIYVSTTAGMLQSRQPVNLGRLLFATDIDGDGKSDLVLEGGANQSSILILYAIDDGRFTEPVRFITGGFPRFAVLGDFKQDGRDLRTDIFILIPPGSFTNFNLEVAILTSDALRGATASRGFGFVPPGAFDSGSPATDIESGDINGDGAIDLVVAAAGLSNAAVLFGNGRGAFSPAVAVNTGIFFGVPTDTELRDFNNDGKLDLALISFNTKNVAVLLGDGRGGFTLSASFFVFNDAQTLASADFNNDGNLDLVTNAQPGGLGGLALFLGDGQGGFTKSADGFGGNSVRFKFITGDFNGDAAADLALFDPLQNPGPEGFTFSVLFGNGQGGFSEPINIRVDFPVSVLRAADLNLDGRDDLIYSSGSGISTVFVVLSKPGGSFASPVPIQIGPGATIKSAKDINGDGKPDLIAVSGFSIISTLLGKGDGSFNQPVEFRAIDSPAVIVAEDFDEDGSVDIALAQTAFVGILLNRSNCVSQDVVAPASAASNFRYRVARNSVVSLHGKNLAPSARTAIPPFLPSSLANTRVKVKDASGVERVAPLYFVSPDRITYLTPAQTSPGVALITVMNGGNTVAQGVASIAETDPGLFSADLSGQGYAAALVLRIRQDGSKVFAPVVSFDVEENRFVAVPIDLSNEAEQVFLLLSGTGIRNHSGLANVKAKVGSENAEVTFAGAEGILPGVDQVNLRLQPSLRGHGEVSVELSVDGRAANTVRIRIK